MECARQLSCCRANRPSVNVNVVSLLMGATVIYKRLVNKYFIMGKEEVMFFKNMGCMLATVVFRGAKDTE